MARRTRGNCAHALVRGSCLLHDHRHRFDVTRRTRNREAGVRHVRDDAVDVFVQIGAVPRMQASLDGGALVIRGHSASPVHCSINNEPHAIDGIQRSCAMRVIGGGVVLRRGPGVLCAILWLPRGLF